MFKAAKAGDGIFSFAVDSIDEMLCIEQNNAEKDVDEFRKIHASKARALSRVSLGTMGRKFVDLAFFQKASHIIILKIGQLK